ncbi:MAG TPA: HAMP domain-containing sensor histidine kinase [Methyloversatilis sp.]
MVMTSIPLDERTDPLNADDDRDAVRRDLLGVLFGHTPTVVAGNIAVSTTAASVLISAGGHPAVWFWLAAIFVLVALRAGTVYWARPRLAALVGKDLDRMEWLHVVMAGLTGLAWGLLPWLGYEGRDPFMDFFSVAMLSGMAGGAMTSTTALPRALNLYLLCALGPFIVKSALIGGIINIAGGVTIFFYMGVLISFSRSAHASMRDALLLTRQNARLADTLRRERDAVQAAMRAKNLFLAGVTHDLRQPVHAIGLHTRYLRSLEAQELDQGTVHEACAGVDAAVHAMSSQLSRLIELSRLEAGEARVVRRALPLADILASCIAQFGPLAREKGLQLDFRPTTALVDSDARMLQSMLDNLVANAVRYTDAGRVLIAARRRRHTIELQVWDTGPGIPDELIPQIFIAYRRFDDRQSRHSEGQGLGLALASKQAERLGHSIRVCSRVGRGSLFAVCLPHVEPVPD